MKWIKWICAIIIVLGVIYFISFEFNPWMDGSPGLSDTIEDSKNKKVYVSTYRSVYDTLSIRNKKYSLKSAEIWLERQFWCTAYRRKIIISDLERYELVMKLDSHTINSIQNFHIRYTTNNEESMGQTSDEVMSALFLRLPDDSIKFIIREGGIWAPKDSMEIVGELVLVKVNE